MRRVTSVMARRVGAPTIGSFSMVMATGIVSAALRQAGLSVPADVMLGIAAAGFVVLACVIGWSAVVMPGVMRADLTTSDRAFTAFTLSAVCAVLGAGLAGVGLVVVAAVLAVAGLAAWLAVTMLVPVRMAASRRARPVIADVNGTWYLWAVATQSLVIVAAFLHTAGLLAARPAAAAALAAWLTGLVTYLLTTALVAARLRNAGAGSPGSRAGYWIAMGGASISVLAAARILGIDDTPAVAAGRPWIIATAIAPWVMASGLISVLATVTAATWLRTRRRLRYTPAAWMVVFPLGMYATASMKLGNAASLPAIRLAGQGFTWPAAAAWVALAAMAVPPLITSPHVQWR